MDLIRLVDLSECSLFYNGTSGPVFIYKKVRTNYFEVCYNGREYFLSDAINHIENKDAKDLIEAFLLLHDSFDRKEKLSENRENKEWIGLPCGEGTTLAGRDS